MPVQRTYGSALRANLPWLYHGTAQPVAGNHLTPRFNKTVGGHEGHFIFASDNRHRALCYGLKNEDMLAVGAMDEGTATFAIIGHRQPYLDKNVTGTVYKFRSAAFARVRGAGFATAEYVSNRPLSLARAEREAVTGIDQLLAEGVQVFFVPDDIPLRDHFHNTMMCDFNPIYMYRTHKLRSENVERGINPDPALVRKFP